MRQFLFTVALLMSGCGITSGGTCVSEDACILFDEDLRNSRAQESCGFITNSLSNDISVTSNYNALRDECPDGDYILDCRFEENLYQARGVIRYKADRYTLEEAEMSCTSLTGAIFDTGIPY